MKNTSSERAEEAKVISFGLAGVSCKGTIDGLLLKMSLSHHYVNHTNKPVELVYTFPLSFKGTLLSCECTIENKVMTGTVITCDAAEQTYEDAVDSGDSAFKLEQNRNGFLTGRLGNLLPNESAVVKISYAEPLHIINNKVRLTVPLIIDSQYYGDPYFDDKLMPIFNDPDNIPVTDPNAQYGFEIHLNIKGFLAKSQISIPSHRASYIKATEKELTIETRFKSLDRDWVCVFDDILTFGGNILLTKANEGFVAAAALTVPYKKDQDKRPPIACKILIDCSGSMSGEGITIADQALRHFISRLDGHDSVSLTKFGSDSQTVFDMREICNWKIKRLLRRNRLLVEANMGGTELENALEKVYGSGADLSNQEALDYGTPILLITDGEIYQTESIISRARESGHRLHILCVGMGSNPGWLKKLADLTHGSLTCITAGEDVNSAIDELADRLIGGIVKKTSFEWNNATETSSLPATLYAGETVWAYATFKKRPEGILKIKTSNGNISISFPNKETAVDETEILARIFGRERMLKTTNNDRRTELALKYQLLSENTQWILTHQRDEKSIQPVTTKIIAQPTKISAPYDPTVFYTQLDTSSFPICDIDSPAPRRNSRKQHSCISISDENQLFEAYIDCTMKLGSELISDLQKKFNTMTLEEIASKLLDIFYWSKWEKDAFVSFMEAFCEDLLVLEKLSARRTHFKSKRSVTEKTLFKKLSQEFQS